MAVGAPINKQAMIDKFVNEVQIRVQGTDGDGGAIGIARYESANKVDSATANTFGMFTNTTEDVASAIGFGNMTQAGAVNWYAGNQDGRMSQTGRRRLFAEILNVLHHGIATPEPPFKEYIMQKNGTGTNLSIAALIDLFVSYTYQLTRYRRVGYTHSGANPTFIAPRLAILNSSYRMRPIDFRNRVNTIQSGGVPVMNIFESGSMITLQNITDFFDGLYQIVFSHANLGEGNNLKDGLVVNTAYNCHSSCHGSCHGSRGRR